MRILTTGINSGIGKYIYEKLGGLALTRSTTLEEWKELKNKGADIIIHCAFNSQKTVNTQTLYQYLNDNVLLTKELALIPHKKFIFMSSIDVYPTNIGPHSEEEVLNIDLKLGMYGITKLMSEAIIKNFCNNYLILRASALLGKYSRKNSLIRMIEDKECKLTLSSNSIFNYVLYPDMLNFIKFSIDNDLKGIYNTVSAENITLSEIAYMLQKDISWGEYFYNCGEGEIDNKKSSSFFTPFKKTSKEVILQFIRGEYD
jgi:nucleoside-diphosphate-sugar epimerase